MKKNKPFGESFYRSLKKTLLTMRIAIILVIMGILQARANDAYSQKTKLSLNFSDAQLISVLDKIENESEYFFLYNEKLLDTERKVTIDEKNQLISIILDELFKSTDVNYTIIDRKIILAPGYLTEKKGTDELKQQFAVSGKVTDSETGEVMPGVNILIKGTTFGTMSDVVGNYSLPVSDRNAVLVFSFIGYVSQEIPLAGRSTLNVTLVSETKGLEEVVVVGYGTQKKVNLTGSVDVIKNTSIASRQSPTVSQLLQGSSPGLNFSVDNNGFQPGAKMDIKIRGIGSLTGGSPYVLIDGVPGDMDLLNPEDIESISIFKDAAASAIYGARAPYGVILITTKSAKKNNKISVTYNGSVSASYVQKMPVMANSVTNARVNNEANRNAGSSITYSDAAIDRMYAYIAGDWDYLKQFTVPDATHFETIPLESGVWAEYNNGHSNHDWFKEFYGGAKLNTKHNFSLQGGSESISYYFSTGYLTQKGDLNYATDNYNRFNLLGKINTKITDWWDLNYEVRFTNSGREYPTMGWEGGYDLLFHQIARAKPMIPMYDGYGHYLEKCMILEVKYAGTDKTQNNDNWQIISTELRPIKNWKINADFSYQTSNQYRRNLAKNAFIYNVKQVPSILGITNPNQIQEYFKNNYYWTGNFYSSYNFNLSDQHAFSLMVGTQLEYARDRGMDAAKSGLLVQDEVPSLQTAIGTPNVSEYISHWATLGYFSRFSYNYKEKYLFESNLRIDGSSRFKLGNRWGIFPSFSAGWNIYKEPFWDLIKDYINTFKLRVSWGSLGNQNVAPYQDLALVPLITQPLDWIWGYGQLKPIGYTGTLPLVSPNLTWETVTTKNIGVNLSFLKNRLNVTYDLFERNTFDMIGPSQAKPGVLGLSVPQENNSSLRTRGFELSLEWKDMINNELSYYINMNFFDNKTIITKYLNPTGTLTTWYKGKEEGEIWGYSAYDLYRSPEES